MAGFREFEVSFRLKLDGTVSEQEVIQALNRALRTVEFGLNGMHANMLVKGLDPNVGVTAALTVGIVGKS